MRLSQKDLNTLLHYHEFPCVSIYIPVDKVGQDTRQGAIRLKKAVKSTFEALQARQLRTPQIKTLLEPAEALYEDTLYWEHQNQGLALFLSPGKMWQHQLSERCEESVTIDDRFRLLPLLFDLSHDQPYYLLALSLEDTRLYRGTRHDLKERPLSEPRSIKAVTESYNMEKQLQHHSPFSGTGGTLFHGSDSTRDVEKQRIDEFFHRLEDNLKKELSGDQTPLIVACVDYLFPIFRDIFKDSRLMTEHISGSPENMKKATLIENSWNIARKSIDQNRKLAIESYQKRSGTERIRNGIGHVLPMAFQGRVDTLLINRTKWAWGQWDPQTGHVLNLVQEPDHWGDPDLLNLAALFTLENSGQVYLLNEDEMPVQSDCACVLRY
jgi:hypothetical protein